MHFACDNQGPLLILCQTDQDRKFGAFTEVGLESLGGYRRSPRSLLFNLNKIPTRFKIKKDKSHLAIFFSDKYGIYFGKGDLVIDFDKIASSYSKLGSIF